MFVRLSVTVDRAELMAFYILSCHVCTIKFVPYTCFAKLLEVHSFHVLSSSFLTFHASCIFGCKACLAFTMCTIHTPHTVEPSSFSKQSMAGRNLEEPVGARYISKWLASLEKW